MKISEFILSSIGLLASCEAEELLPAVIFGILAIMAFRKAMWEFQDAEEEDWEGGEDDERGTF
ncbi:MAG: hypothetical protein KH828_07670 [Clostridiales bacterium]|nr:hypothetical protein [Clostridiales bacterium]